MVAAFASWQCTCMICILCIALFCWTVDAITSVENSRSILVVGATGTTGLRSIQGLLDVGYKPAELFIVTRDKSRSKMIQLQQLGFNLIQADLQRPSSLHGIGKGCYGCYIHATGGDTKELDASEVSSAQNLCKHLHSDVKCIVYNSAAGAKDHGVQRIQQKHDIERILSRRRSPSSVTSLRANIFGEELWKEYNLGGVSWIDYALCKIS